MASPPQDRFFLALLPPQPIQDEANDIRQHFADRYASRAAQKSPPHITLQPPFEWHPEHLPELTQRLAGFASCQSAIPITLNGFAAFPPRVIFIDVQRSPELLQLQQELTGFLKDQCGIVDERHQGRAFAPHLTVAFRDLTRQNFKLAWQEFEGRSFFAEFFATHLVLLIHTGQRWIVHQAFPFKQTEDRGFNPFF